MHLVYLSHHLVLFLGLSFYVYISKKQIGLDG